MSTPTDRIRKDLGSKKSYRLTRPEITIDELIKLKRTLPPYSVRKVAFGITPEMYGHVYDVGKYRFTLKESPEEIERRLKEMK